MATKKHVEKTDWQVGKPLVKATIRFDDCPTCRGRVRDTQCQTCEIRARREAEPDTWYHKPKRIADACMSAAIRWDNAPGKNKRPLWADLDKVHAHRPPLEMACIRLLVCINFGVNVDRIPVPLIPRFAREAAWKARKGKRKRA